jgi:hypothetical protein
MRVRPHNHRLHGETLKPRVRARLRHARGHRLGGGARFGRGGEPKVHAANLGLMGDVLRQHLDSQRRRLFELRDCDPLHLLRRCGDAGRHGGNAVSRKHRLGLGLREQRALGSRRGPHGVESRLAIDA